MATLSAEQAASALYNAGFREPDLSKMVAIGHRESRYKTDAHRTDQPSSKLSGDRGLFQINYVHDKALMNAGIIDNKSDLFDPAKNAAAAFYLYKQGGLKPWSAGPGGWSANGDPLYGTNLQAAQTATSNFLADPSKYGTQGAPDANGQIDVGVVTGGGLTRDLGPAVEVPDAPTRSTEYDPTYTPPEVDPEAQKGLTDMLSRFGIDYPDAPRATPQLLAFMRGLGMTYDTLEDIQRNTVSRVEGRSADSLQDLQRADQRKRETITGVQQQKNVLSSGATNTKFARQAEDMVAETADIARRKSEAIGEASDNLALGQDQLRQGANEKVIAEEEKQAVADALAKEQVRDFQSRRDEADFQYEREERARKEALKAQQDLYASTGLGVVTS